MGEDKELDSTDDEAILEMDDDEISARRNMMNMETNANPAINAISNSLATKSMEATEASPDILALLQKIDDEQREPGLPSIRRSARIQAKSSDAGPNASSVK